MWKCATAIIAVLALTGCSALNSVASALAAGVQGTGGYADANKDWVATAQRTVSLRTNTPISEVLGSELRKACRAGRYVEVIIAGGTPYEAVAKSCVVVFITTYPPYQLSPTLLVDGQQVFRGGTMITGYGLGDWQYHEMLKTVSVRAN